MKLPVKLDRPTIVEAIFEIRFGYSPAVESVFPGALFSEFANRNQKVTSSQLPVAQIPEAVRQKDPNLAYLPTIALNLEKFSVLLGNRVMLVSCKLPYPSWEQFNNKILEIIGFAKKFDLFGPIERYSLKYVNLVEKTEIEEQIKSLNLSITIGEIKVNNQPLTIKTESIFDNDRNIVTIQTGVEAVLESGDVKRGVLIDIDSIRLTNNSSSSEIFDKLSSEIETLKTLNKKTFFECLTSDTIISLGPHYA